MGKTNNPLKGVSKHKLNDPFKRGKKAHKRHCK